MNKEDEKIVQHGKEIWEKKLKKLKLSFSSSDVSKIARNLKYENNRHFYLAISQGRVNLDEVLMPQKELVTEEHGNVLAFDHFASIARQDAGELVVDGSSERIMYSFAKCCNPIPGDPIIGYITIGEGIKIHRKTCNNLINLSSGDSSKLVPVQWPKTEGSTFVAGISMRGDDTPGILNEIAHTIVSYKNTNIKSININTNDSSFEGNVTVYVEDLEHLNRIIDRLKKIKGMYIAERFESN